MPHNPVVEPATAQPVDRLVFTLSDPRGAHPSAPQLAEFCMAGD